MSVLGVFRRGRRLPVVLTSEVAECGLACISMVASFYGNELTLNALRQRFSLSLSGTTLRDIMRLARELGLGARALRMEVESLRGIRLPAILHWDFQHFVVLSQLGRVSAVIHDPARGARTVSLSELSKRFTGVVLELEPTVDFSTIRGGKNIAISSLWSHATGLRSAVGQVLCLSLALQCVAFAAPFQVQLVVDDAIAQSDAHLLVVLALGFAFLASLQAALEALRNWTVQVFNVMLTYQATGNIVHHLFRLPAVFFEKRHVGDVISRIGSASAIQDAIARGMFGGFLDGVMAIMLILIMCIYSTGLATISLLFLVMMLVGTFAFYPGLRRRNEERLAAAAREQSFFMETVRGISTIKMFGGEAYREGAWRNLYSSLASANLSSLRYQGGVALLQGVLTGIQTVAIVYFGARKILDGAGFSIGMFYAFLSFQATLNQRVSSLLNEVVQFRLIGLHLERLSDIITAVPEVDQSQVAMSRPQGGIRLENVWFKYGESDPYVLSNFSIEIAPGEFVAVVGRSGGGKTTLLRLLTGMRIPSVGEVYLDGRRATPALWVAWRQGIAVVSQDDRLLSGSIADNIAFFDPELDMSRIQAAAKRAQIHDEIVAMPMQYASLIGDMGSMLSGGQRQRVLLARALYRGPALLILDEGTANLDAETEAKIGDIIGALKITRIVVAHRPALIERADRIVVI